MMNKTLFLLAGLILTWPSMGADRPNIVFILADDLGGHDIGCYGSTFHPTPHLDALAKKGMLFTNAYSSSPLCSPTRSSILTGQAPARIGITAPVCHLPQVVLKKALAKGGPGAKVLNAESVTRLDTNYVTLAEVLREAGYRTGHFGKWHLGPEPYSPLQHGFDVDLPHTPGPGPGGGNGYFAPWTFWKGQGEAGDHIEDRMAEEAVKFMRENKERPFFLNYWAFSVHSPWMGKADYIEEAATKADPKAAQRNPMYAAMVRSLDDAVGRLMMTLDELKLAENTIVIFTSDNGAWHNPPKEATKSAAYATIPVTSNAPLRSGKASNYEGGTRVPLLIRWPGKIEAGGRSNAVVQSVDFFPTLMELTQLTAPESVKFDGVSIAPAFQGQPLPREAIFCHFPHGGRSDIEGFLPGTWVRRGEWKLIRFFADNEDGSDRLELYHLGEDVGEARNRAAEKPEVVAELNALITQYLKETEAVVPVRNPGYNVKAAAVKKPVRVGPWTHSKDAQLAVAAGELKVTSTGGDPWLATTEIPAKLEGPFLVRLRMKSTARGAGVVYFSKQPNEVFHKDRTVVFTPQTDGQFHDYEVLVPARQLHALRLDPGNSAGDIVLTRFSLHREDGNEIKNWISAP